MSAIMDTKLRRERVRTAIGLRDKALAEPPKDITPDLALLSKIAASPNGWHAAALDPYKKAHLRDAGLVVIRRDRVRITNEGRTALTRQRWATAHDGRVRPEHQ